MSEQSLRDRLHPSVEQSAAENRSVRLKLLMGAVVGIVAGVLLASFRGISWAVPALLVGALCSWGFLARGRPRIAS